MCLAITDNQPCRQYECINVTETSDCNRVDQRAQYPACDTLAMEHSQICWLIKKGRQLAYNGLCLVINT